MEKFHSILIMDETNHNRDVSFIYGALTVERNVPDCQTSFCCRIARHYFLLLQALTPVHVTDTEPFVDGYQCPRFITQNKKSESSNTNQDCTQPMFHDCRFSSRYDAIAGLLSILEAPDQAASTSCMKREKQRISRFSSAIITRTA